MPVAVKRVYDSPARADGRRVLVDRPWLRGFSKEQASIDNWLRDLAPSTELRKWFDARPSLWPIFRKRYLKELADPKATTALDRLHRLADESRRLTLLFAAADDEHNNAIVLKDLLEGMRKPPTGTGPRGARSAQDRQVKRMPRR